MVSESKSMTQVLEEMRIREAEIARYDALIISTKEELKHLKEAQEEQIDALRLLARGQQPLPLEG